MTQDEIIEMAKQAGSIDSEDVILTVYNAFTSVEREACAKIFDEVMPLVPFAQNDQGGCLICGFTPKLAAKAIRARGQA